MPDYHYLHETVKLKYSVKVRPAPADRGKAVFHRHTPEGAEITTDEGVQLQGKDLPYSFVPKDKNLTTDDSPVFVVFRFEKGEKTDERKVGVSLASPMVGAISAPKEASPGDTVDVKVSTWIAQAFDRPGRPSAFPEKKPDARLDQTVKDGVKWTVDGSVHGSAGATIQLAITDEHVAKTLALEGYLGEATGKAKASIAVPKVTLTTAKNEAPPPILLAGTKLDLKASVEPLVDGTWKWTSADPALTIKSTGSTATLLAKSAVAAADGKVKVTAELTSSATKKKYKAEHELKVYEIAVKAEDGTSDPPKGVLVEKEVKLKAVVKPDDGTYAWAAKGTHVTLADETTATVKVTATAEPSAKEGEDALELVFTPTGHDAFAPIAVPFTVVNLEVVSDVKPADMKGVLSAEDPPRKTRSKFVVAPVIVGVSYPIKVRAFLEPAGLKKPKFTWTPTGLTTNGKANKEVYAFSASAASAALDDKELKLEVETPLGKFDLTHKLTAVSVEIEAVKKGIVVKSTDDLNRIHNPASIPILAGTDKDDVKKVPIFKITKIDPDPGWTDDDKRIAWWIRGDDDKKGYGGKADFLNDEKAKYGKTIQVYGTGNKDKPVLIQPYSGGFPYGMLRTQVLELKKLKYRISRILTTGVGAKAPSSSHADAKKHMKIVNIYLRQAAIEMIPDDSAEVASSAGNVKVGDAALDSKVVSVTKDSNGHFDVEVNDVNLTFNAPDGDARSAIRINARNEVISLAYTHSTDDPSALATAKLCPYNHAPKARKSPPRPYVSGGSSHRITDKGTTSTSLIKKTGLPGDTPADAQTMIVLFPDVSWKDTQVDRHIDLLWGVIVPNSTIDSSGSATGGEATLQAYGNTLAHEIGHVLGLGHRGTGGAVKDGLDEPADENLMHPDNPPPTAIDIDLLQVKAIRFSEACFRAP